MVSQISRHQRADESDVNFQRKVLARTGGSRQLPTAGAPHRATAQNLPLTRPSPRHVKLSYSQQHTKPPTPPPPPSLANTHHPTTPHPTPPRPPHRTAGAEAHKTTAQHGHPRPPLVGPPADPACQHREPPRELLPKVLPLPRALVAPALVRRRRRLAPQALRLRLPQDRGVCARQDGGGARGRCAARAHHQLERHEDAPEAGHCGEADEAESYVNCPILPSSPSRSSPPTSNMQASEANGSRRGVQN